MSRQGFLTGAGVDLLIQALRAGGYLADDASATAIRDADPSMTEAQRDAIAAALNYGGVGGGGGIIVSNDDVDVLIDADDSNPTTPYSNFFRVSRGQNGVPVTDPDHEMFSVEKGPTSLHTIARLGPNASITPDGQNHRVKLMLGTGGTPAAPYSIVQADENGLEFFLQDGYTAIRAGEILFRNLNGSTRGGFDDMASVSRFFIGSSATGNCLHMEQISGQDYLVKPNTVAEKKIFIKGRYPNETTDPRVQVAIAGSPNQGGLDPDTPGLVGDHKATMLICAPPDQTLKRAALYVYHRAENIPNDTDLVCFDSRINIQTSPPGLDPTRVSLFRVRGLDNAVLPRGAFRVRADGNCRALGGFTTGTADLAEMFDTGDVEAKNYAPGTVMIVDENGHAVPSYGYEDKRVLGVVSEKPGFLLNGGDIASDEIYLTPIALSGRVNVNVTNAYGGVEPGDLLVSAPKGESGKAPAEAKAGTVIGKALGTVKQAGEGEPYSTHSIEMLVFHR